MVLMVMMFTMIRMMAMTRAMIIGTIITTIVMTITGIMMIKTTWLLQQLRSLLPSPPPQTLSVDDTSAVFVNHICNELNRCPSAPVVGVTDMIFGWVQCSSDTCTYVTSNTHIRTISTATGRIIVAVVSFIVNDISEPLWHLPYRYCWTRCSPAIQTLHWHFAMKIRYIYICLDIYCVKSR